MPLETVALFFLIRFVLTIASSCSSAAGGLFIPVLALGALLGSCTAEMIPLLLPEQQPDRGLFAVVGMAAYFTGVAHVPLTAIVLIIEMTGNYALILPLFIACFPSCLSRIARGTGRSTKPHWRTPGETIDAGALADGARAL